MTKILNCYCGKSPEGRFHAGSYSYWYECSDWKCISRSSETPRADVSHHTGSGAIDKWNNYIQNIEGTSL